MLTDNPDLRPLAISESLSPELDELSRLRHVVRSLYAFEFDQNRIVDLIQKLEILWEPLQQELRDFAELLQVIANLDP